MSETIYSALTQLGGKTALPASQAAAVLERVANPHPGERYLVRFTAPEYRTLTVGLLTVDELAKTIEPTEDEIKAAFDARADEFQTGERRSFVQVLVDGEDKARAVAEKARALKGDLEAAAKAEAAGLKVVMNRCPKIEYGRLSSEISWMGVNSRTLSSKRAPVPTQGMRLSLNRVSVGGGGTNAADRAARNKNDPA